MTTAITKQLEFTDHAGQSIAPPQSFNPMMLVERAIEKNVDAATLERLTAVGERWMETQARQQFAEAIANFQRECPPIHKSRTAQGGRMSFQFAGLDDIEKIARPIRSKYGISVTYDVKMLDGLMHATCRVRVGSYAEESTVPVPIPKEMVVGDTQKYGAAVSYAKRYALCAALNIVVTNEDNENALNASAPITPEQMKELNDLMQAKGVELSRFLKWAEVDSLSELSQGKFKAAIPMLNAKKPVVKD